MSNKDETVTMLVDKLNSALNSVADAVKIDIEYVPMIVEALERRISRKPEFKKGRYYFSCPVCGADVRRWDEYFYCKKCGTRIDWSDDE